MLPIYPPECVSKEVQEQVESQYDGSNMLIGIRGNKWFRLQTPLECDAYMVYQTEGPLAPLKQWQELAQKAPVGIMFSGGHTNEQDSLGYNQTPTLWMGNAVPRLPLMGRSYVYGIHDCLSLVRDYYDRELKILFPDQIRRTDVWWKDGINHIETGYQSRGFKLTQNPKVGDVVVFQFKDYDQPTHVGVLQQDAQVLHHLINRESEVSKLSVLERMRMSIIGYLRHEWNDK